MTDTAGLIADLTQLRKEIIDPHIHIINEAHDANVITRAIAEITRLSAALAGGGGVNGSDPVAESAASGPSGPSKGTNWGEILRERMWSVATDGWSGDAWACDPDQAANVALDVLCEALNP